MTSAAMSGGRWGLVTVVTAAVLLGIFGFLVASVPVTEEGRDWFAPMVEGGWMAWTFPVALFFWLIGSILVIFTLLAIRFPETPRRGVLRIETTRGDRLFISLLGSAFISIGWMFSAGPPLWGALAISLVYAVAVFRWV